MLRSARTNPFSRIAAAATAALAATALAATFAVTAAGAAGTMTWTSAQDVPGIVALDTNHDSGLAAISCAPTSGANCSAGGDFTDASGSHAFLVDKIDGVWGIAFVVPGLAALDVGNGSRTTAVSCPTATDCVAVGSFKPSATTTSAWVASKTGGTWGTATAVAGLTGGGGLATGNYSSITDISCPSVGNCSAVGNYTSTGNHGFTLDLTAGTWGTATAIGGITAYASSLTSVSCSSAGNCTSGGEYTNGVRTGFVIDRVAGTWSNAAAIPGLNALDTGNGGVVEAVSCATDGNCTVAGNYKVGSRNYIFTATRTSGTWGTAAALPNLATLDIGGFPRVGGISCWSATDCSLVGSYSLSTGGKGFVADRIAGTWGNAATVPGLDALDTGDGSSGLGVSCTADGSCALVGYYESSSSTMSQGYAANRTSGAWGNAIAMPGLSAMNTGYADPKHVSCGVGACSAGGYYNPAAQQMRAFVIDYVPVADPVTTTTTASTEPVTPKYTG